MEEIINKGFTPEQEPPIGGVILATEDLEYNSGRDVITMKVKNCGSRPIQVGSHFHFFEVLTPKKDVLFIIGDWNTKVGSQETPGVTGKFGLGIRNEAGQRLIEFCQENALVITNTLFQQHKRRLYTWTSPDGKY